VRHFIWLGVLLSLLVVAAAADRITLNNGDQLTGQIKKLEHGTLRFYTTYAGELSIDWREVDTVVSDRVFAFGLRNGRFIGGRLLTLDRDVLRVETLTGPEEVRRADLTIINETEIPLGRPRWSGLLDLALDLLTGNARRDDIRLAFRLHRQLRNGASFTARAIYDYGKSGDEVNSDTLRAELRYASSGRRRYTSWFALLETDTAERLNQRVDLGLGLGYRWISAPNRFLTTEFNLAYTAQDFKQFNRDGLSMRASLELYQPFWGNSILYGSVNILPDLDDFGEWRAWADFTLIKPLIGPLSLNLSLYDTYDSNPAPGVRRNDLRIQSSLGFSF